MVELLPVLGSLGGGGVLLGVIVYQLAHIRAIQVAASERIKVANDRADEAEARARVARAAEDAQRDRANTAETALALARLQLPPAPVDPTAPPALPPGGEG